MLTRVASHCLTEAGPHSLLVGVCTQKKDRLIQLSNQRMSTPTRFELARAEPIGFQNQLLNHSDTVSPAWSIWAAGRGVHGLLSPTDRQKIIDTDEI
jgi:hypothetical protein